MRGKALRHDRFTTKIILNLINGATWILFRVGQNLKVGRMHLNTRLVRDAMFAKFKTLFQANPLPLKYMRLGPEGRDDNPLMVNPYATIIQNLYFLFRYMFRSNFSPGTTWKKT